MKKSEMMVGLGIPGDPGADESSDYEDAEAAPGEEAESDEDEAIDSFLDPKTDPETRREMFRKAVASCTKRG